MKTAIYIEDGVLQLVLTPETEHEISSLALFKEHQIDAKIFSGSFYDCRGGWIRQSAHYPKNVFEQSYYREQSKDDSLILRINHKKPEVIDG